VTVWDVVVSEAELAEARAEAESRMTSRVTIRRPPAPGATATVVNGFEVRAWSTVASGVPFRLGGNQGAGAYRRVTVGSAEVQVATRIGSLPASQTDLKDGDFLDVTAGESAGLVLRVVEAIWQDQATARRVPVVEVQRPEEW